MKMPSAEVLTPLLSLDPQNFHELAEACRRFVGAWIAAGNDPHDEIVLGFVSIDSQADDIGRWVADLEADQADFYSVFYPAFILEREAWRNVASA